jgi:hypothetical protein
MTEGVIRGSFAHVVGTFNLEQGTGTIDYVTPVQIAAESADLADEGLRLVGEDEANHRLFEKVVNPQRNSCAPTMQRGTYEEFVPAPSKLRRIKLLIQGAVAAEFVRGSATGGGTVAFGAPIPDAPHRFALAASSGLAPAPGVTYIVQAKPADAPVWHTIGVGLKTPSTEVDVNQFPGAKRIAVRVLRSDGFSETEIFHNEKRFD